MVWKALSVRKAPGSSDDKLGYVRRASRLPTAVERNAKEFNRVTNVLETVSREDGE